MSNYYYVKVPDWDGQFEYALKNACFLMEYRYEIESAQRVSTHWNRCRPIKAGDYFLLGLGENGTVHAIGRVCAPQVDTRGLPEHDSVMQIVIDNKKPDYTDGFVFYKDSEVFYEDLNSDNGFNGSWGQRIDVEKWEFYNNDGISNTGVDNEIIAGIHQDTVFQITQKYFCKMQKKLKEIFMENETILDKCARLLKTNYNLILTGAPGTGKTHLAKEIAAKMIFGDDKKFDTLTDSEKEQFKDQCAFVQFHPSYDYTDFVEGLRPTTESDATTGAIAFERRNGVFKEFCEKAVKNIPLNVKNNFDECWEKLTIDIANCEDENGFEIPTKKYNHRALKYSLNTANSLKCNNMNCGSFTKDNIFNVYQGKKGRTCGAFQTYMDDVVIYLKSKYGLMPYTPQKTVKNFIFIIDEINRGEISKIFGELFFAIDPGYRGERGKVKTQYQNLVQEGDVFYDGFYVPKNVYVIGTMNDIDRSVEPMDFAMHRRFAWKEILPSDTADAMRLSSESKNRMKKLNEQIAQTEGLGSAYFIGGAYFLKLSNYKNDEDGGYSALWENHLEPLLKEYLRGQDDEKNKLDALKIAYDNPTSDSSDGQ